MVPMAKIRQVENPHTPNFQQLSFPLCYQDYLTQPRGRDTPRVAYSSAGAGRTFHNSIPPTPAVDASPSRHGGGPHDTAARGPYIVPTQAPQKRNTRIHQRQYLTCLGISRTRGAGKNDGCAQMMRVRRDEYRHPTSPRRSRGRRPGVRLGRRAARPRRAAPSLRGRRRAAGPRGRVAPRVGLHRGCPGPGSLPGLVAGGRCHCRGLGCHPG